MAALRRTLGFALVWFAFAGAPAAGTAAGDVAAGVLAIAAAVVLSLRLLPPVSTPSLPGTLRFAVRFLVQSLRAGLDVARRAFDPSLPLQPGFVEHPTALAPGTRRNALVAVLSLQPGTLPVPDAAGDALRIHCLDEREPIQAQLAADEAAFRAMAGREARHD